MIGTIILLIVVGLIAGALARLLLPGRDSMGIIATIVLGIVGAFVGGLLWGLVSLQKFTIVTGNWFANIIAAIIGAIVLLLILRLVRSRRVA